MKDAKDYTVLQSINKLNTFKIIEGEVALNKDSGAHK